MILLVEFASMCFVLKILVNWGLSRASSKKNDHFSSAEHLQYLTSRNANYRIAQWPSILETPWPLQLWGFITALVLNAHFEYPNSVVGKAQSSNQCTPKESMYENLEAQAGRLLFLAYVLLGDFLAFDWHLGGILENGEYFSFEKKGPLVV